MKEIFQMKASAFLGSLLAFAIGGAAYAEPVKIGVILPQTGVGGILAKQMQAAIELAMTHLDGKIGGQPTEITWGDSQAKVDVAKQLADEMVKSKKVNFVVGPLFSSEMMAVYAPVARADTFVISPIAGPGADCGQAAPPTSSMSRRRTTSRPKRWAPICRSLASSAPT